MKNPKSILNKPPSQWPRPLAALWYFYISMVMQWGIILLAVTLVGKANTPTDPQLWLNLLLTTLTLSLVVVVGAAYSRKADRQRLKLKNYRFAQ